jgi:crotonobetainyl-CoA hydratase
VSAREGLELGFVNEVVPAGQALSTAERWANQICQNSPMSIRASKQAVLEGLNVPLPEAMTSQRGYPAVREMLASADYVEGPKAFAEKRPPLWQGK